MRQRSSGLNHPPDTPSGQSTAGHRFLRMNRRAPSIETPSLRGESGICAENCAPERAEGGDPKTFDGNVGAVGSVRRRPGCRQ
ncbi:hypothetical protein [Haladaptatus halobius]|uniref:hypothetical protein n=1 Tax=Haladaptatus halobius TaxID=2884875 RepID=UPI001D0A4F54|nr:hypothetical protein [Haladaptatus halobius]